MLACQIQSDVRQELPLLALNNSSLHIGTFNLLAVAIVVELTVSANLLTWIGDPYVSEGGSFLAKVHPGTYLIFAAFLTEISRRGSSNSSLWTYLWRGRGATTFIMGMSMCIAFELVLTGTGSVIVLIDTFLPAGVLAVLATSFLPRQKFALLGCVQLCLSVNAVLAIVESLVQSQLIPLYLNGAAYHAAVQDFRPTALFDHPLTGSALNMIGILLPRVGNTSARLRVCYLLLLWLSLLAYGGRTAFLLTCLASAGKLLRPIATSAVKQRQLSATSVWTLIAAVCCSLLAISVTAVTGVGTRLFGHLYWDASADVRVNQWQILDLLDSNQLLFGCKRDQLIELLNPLHLSSGVEVIENFWLLEFVSLGAISFPFFVGGLFSLLSFCIRRAGPGSTCLAATFLVAATSSNSLGRKSNLLIVLVGALSTMSPLASGTTQRTSNLQPGKLTC